MLIEEPKPDALHPHELEINHASKEEKKIEKKVPGN